MGGRKGRPQPKPTPIQTRRDPERELSYAGDRFASACASGATERARVRQERLFELREQLTPEKQAELDESDRERVERIRSES